MRLSAPDPNDAARRTQLAVAVRDTDVIEKVADAGRIVERDGRRWQVMHNGLLVEPGGYGGPFMTDIIAELRGHHEPQEERAFHELLDRLAAEPEQDRSFIEIGAFWAFYAMWFAVDFPEATLVLVEPDPGNLAVGRRNLAVNGIEADIVEAAVGAGQDEIVLPFESDGKFHRVPLVDVETLLERAGGRCDVLLCDAQGAELSVVTDAAPHLHSGAIRYVCVSTHHHETSGDPLTHQHCLDVLEGIGAQIVAEHTVYESCSGDGLIVASCDPRDRGFTVPITHVRAKDSLFGEPEHELADAQRCSTLARTHAVTLARKALTAPPVVRRWRG